MTNICLREDVLILVVMDVSCESEQTIYRILDAAVLILVVMDVSCEHSGSNA